MTQQASDDVVNAAADSAEPAFLCLPHQFVWFQPIFDRRVVGETPSTIAVISGVTCRIATSSAWRAYFVGHRLRRL